MFESPLRLRSACADRVCMRLVQSLLRMRAHETTAFCCACADPAPTEWPHTGRININDLPVFYVTTNFMVQNITALNGPIRQIPMTQNSQRPWPSLRDEPEWMKRSTVCPVPEGVCVCV